MSRRRFLRQATAGLSLAAACVSLEAADRRETLRFGLVTDVHYADVESRGSRHYRDSLAKLEEAIATFNKLDLSFVIELGDFIDSGKTKADERTHLRTIDNVYCRFRGHRYYVLGNHCLAALTKAEFLQTCRAGIKRSYYSFNHGSWHFVVLDANFRRDGSPYAAGNFQWTDTWIPETELEWLRDDLRQAGQRPTVVFIHQNLDNEKDPHGVKNGAAVRKVLEQSGTVVAVFQGHKHTGGYVKIAGIPYVTLRAMVEGAGLKNNAFAMAISDASQPKKLEGFGQQVDVLLE
ncbi:MAG: alkaline phosphatase [Planctomycetes bacterium]|nr:alkaline phosphatase [Planctomycetota bacterium]